VVPALEELGRSYALAVITNGPADVQRMKLRVTGLDRFFAAVIISSEIGLAKPHQRAFAAAVEALQVGKEEIVMVGDHPERDVVGAQDAGIWVDRTGAGAPPGFHPPHRVRQLGELSALILGT
jgi:putative hydrolase of the HAD superfamily